MIIDSHCHIYDEKLKDVKADILKNLQNDNQIAVCCADSVKTSKLCVELANENTNVFAGVGVHPELVNSFNAGTLGELNDYIKNKKVVAIGEIGLDYYYSKETRLQQIEILKQQIVFACFHNLPIIFHVRDAMDDFLKVIKELKTTNKIRGVVHSFSGSVETAKELIKLGFYLGVNGIVTFKNANKMLDVVKFLPLNKILIETDSPYLTPVPYRGQVNRPEYVKLVAQKIAELKQISTEEVINATTQNAKDLFNLKV